jgi:hypothetical protein
VLHFTIAKLLVWLTVNSDDYEEEWTGVLLKHYFQYIKSMGKPVARFSIPPCPQVRVLLEAAIYHFKVALSMLSVSHGSSHKLVCELEEALSRAVHDLSKQGSRAGTR